MANPISLKTFYVHNFITLKKKKRYQGLIFLELSKYKRNAKSLCTDAAKYEIFIFWQVLNMQPTQSHADDWRVFITMRTWFLLAQGGKSQLYQSMLMFLCSTRILIICLVRKLFQKVYLERCIISLRRMIK